MVTSSFEYCRVAEKIPSGIPIARATIRATPSSRAVVSADHGHLFFPVDREESMRIDKPGGHEVEGPCLSLERHPIGQRDIVPPDVQQVVHLVA